ncbi:glutathione S-transferase N-terminal domain-containing protein [Gaiella sp.]|uniref:glutathione S-transferase N-terminal domain-containing protein n=1 Tax=Gaiella sp. TaxID=2663207 RepID=UPI002E32EC4B|nr:glutathione S-transferase N-terminal domain-containing protein [Gaiella sp.]HEX5583683.1 glutathione S-transferase N-terminal domain-containing protein [Gaiella sp.]
MLELWQAEWCPYSHRVRLRLTELRLDWVARAVPIDRAQRDAMEAATGGRSIPTLVDGDVVVEGDDEILAYLDERHAEPPDAARHRAQMRAEWPLWIELEGR